MYPLPTPPAEVAQALLVVMRRGSLRAAEAMTGHTMEAISVWLQRAAQHADAWTAIVVHDLHLTTVESDAFGSFVRKKPAHLRTSTLANAGAVLSKTVTVASSLPGRIGADLIAASIAAPGNGRSTRPLPGAAMAGKAIASSSPSSIAAPSQRASGAVRDA